MGARSFIVRGKGNAESFCACSHGAGRAMSRAEAKRRLTVADNVRMVNTEEANQYILNEKLSGNRPRVQVASPYLGEFLP